MENFEEQYAIRILIFLLENVEKDYSKYEVIKMLKTSRKPFNKRLEFLKKQGLVSETTDVGPRNRTELRLTDLGKEIATHFKSVKEKLKF